MFLRHTIAALVLFSFLGTTAVTAATPVPPEVSTLLFKKSDFVEPLTIPVPPEIERNFFEDNRRFEEKHSGTNLTGNVDLQDRRIRLLYKCHLISIETIHSIAAGDRDFAFYLPEGRKYLSKPRKPAAQQLLENLKWTEEQKEDPDEPVRPRELQVAARRLVAITYTNRFKGDLMGIGDYTKFALTFTYKLVGLIPCFPQSSEVIKGKAVFYQEPTDGEWNLLALTLGNSEEEQYLAGLVSDQPINIKPTVSPGATIADENSSSRQLTGQGPGHQAASAAPFVPSDVGTATYPAKLTKPSDLFRTFRSGIVEAGYAIDAEDEPRGILYASRVLQNAKFFMSVEIASQPNGSIDVILSRGCSKPIHLTDIPAIFQSITEELHIDPSKVGLKIGKEQRPLPSWR